MQLAFATLCLSAVSTPPYSATLMATTFLHTADLHLGRHYGNFHDGEVATQLADARYLCVEAIARSVTDMGAAFVVVAGDLFHTARPTGKVLAKALQALGKISVPIYVIPGNHDPGGSLGPYSYDTFLRYKDDYAPNLHILETTEPLLLDDHEVVLLPCPVIGRPISDPSEHLRNASTFQNLPVNYARVALAHGPTRDFSSEVAQASVLNFDRWVMEELDYVALGDWHGMTTWNDKIRYAGTPEPDRFPRSADYTSGRSLAVTVARGETPKVVELTTGRYDWKEEKLTLRTFEDVERLDRLLLAPSEAGGRLLKLALDGSLSVADRYALEQRIARLREVYLHIDLDDEKLLVKPGAEELSDLTGNSSDPTVALVARRLSELAEEENEVARLALVKLYEAVNHPA